MSDEPPILANDGGTSEPPVLQPDRRYRAPDPNEPSLNPFHEIHTQLDGMLGKESYGAPRVFDLFTLLAITLAFALLFTLLKFLQPALEFPLGDVVLTLCCFITFLALAQSLMFGGKKPRLASIYAGPIVWILTTILLSIINWRSILYDPSILAGPICTLLFSPFAGYLGGGVVAGVFLMADSFRKQIVRTDATDEEAEDDSIFEMEDDPAPREGKTERGSGMPMDDPEDPFKM